jgi:hypothetical protein
MPQPCPKASRVPSRRKRQRPSPTPRPAPSRIAALFRLDDEGELRAFDWLQRFHSHGSIHRLLDVARAGGTPRHADVFMLTRSLAQREGAQPEYLMIRYQIEEIRASWQTFPTLDEARAVFAAAVANPKPAAEVSHG